MTAGLALIDASAFWRIRALDAVVTAEISARVARGLVAASTPLLLEIHSGRDLPPVELRDLPILWLTEPAERRAAELQLQMRAAHQHLGIPPLDYLSAAIAEDHLATLLHYDADFERIAAHTDLRAELEPLAPLGTLA